MAFKLNASAYQQELHKSDPISINQIVATMQKVSPEAKAVAFGKLGAKYSKLPQPLAALYAAYPNGVSLPVARVVPQDIFLNYAENGYAPVMDMGEDAFVVMNTKTGLFHQFDRKANAICSDNGVDFNSIIKDMQAEESWRSSLLNLKASFSGLKEATESFEISSKNIELARQAKAKIQNALDVVAKEGWDENKPYTLGLGTSVESICKVKNSLITAEKATAALESLMDKEVLGLEGLDVDWQSKWDAIKEGFRKFWKAIKDFFQAMWTKIRSYIGPNRDVYKTVDTVNKVAKEAGLAAELEKINKSFTFDSATGTFVFPDEIKQEVIEAFKAKLAALPEDKKTVLKKMLDPNYQSEIKMTSSGGLNDEKTEGKATVNPGQDPQFNFKHESDVVQNSMNASECLDIALETLNADIDPNSFVPYGVTGDMFNTVGEISGMCALLLAALKHSMADGNVSKNLIQSHRNSVPEKKSLANKYMTLTSDPKAGAIPGKYEYDITLTLKEYAADANNAWNILEMGQFIKTCDEKGIPGIQTYMNDLVQMGDYILSRLDVVKFDDDVTPEDIEFYKNTIAGSIVLVNDCLKLAAKVVAHIMKFRAACMRAMMEITDGVKQTVMEA